MLFQLVYVFIYSLMGFVKEKLGQWKAGNRAWMNVLIESSVKTILQHSAEHS